MLNKLYKRYVEPLMLPWGYTAAITEFECYIMLNNILIGGKLAMYDSKSENKETHIFFDYIQFNDCVSPLHRDVIGGECSFYIALEDIRRISFHRSLVGIEKEDERSININEFKDLCKCRIVMENDNFDGEQQAGRNVGGSVGSCQHTDDDVFFFKLTVRQSVDENEEMYDTKCLYKKVKGTSVFYTFCFGLSKGRCAFMLCHLRQLCPFMEIASCYEDVEFSMEKTINSSRHDTAPAIDFAARDKLKRGGGNGSLSENFEKGVDTAAAGDVLRSESREEYLSSMERKRSFAELSSTSAAVSVFSGDGKGGDITYAVEENSDIFTKEMFEEIGQHMPDRTSIGEMRLVYSTAKHGISIKTMYRRATAIVQEQLVSPIFLLAIKDTNNIVFGAMITDAPHLSTKYYGNGESFVFTYKSGRLQVFDWSQTNYYFVMGTSSSFSIGSDNGHNALWIDEKFEKGTSQSCSTYNSPSLSISENFTCHILELWAT